MKSFEMTLLTKGMSEKCELAAYKKLLRSSIPQLSGIVPGSSEIASAARTYLSEHKNFKKALPFFTPLRISELNRFAILAGRNVAVYKYANRIRKKKIHLVADTRLFALNPIEECLHVILHDDGFAEIANLKKHTVLYMLPPEYEIFISPLELVEKCINAEVNITFLREELSGLTFLDLKRDFNLLNKVSILLERPISLIAVNKTSWFKLGTARKRSPPKLTVSEQRLSAELGGGKLMNVFLEVRDGAVVACVNVDERHMEKQKTQVDNRPAFAKEAVKRKRKATSEAPADPSKPDESKKKRFTPHVRLDERCLLDGSDKCEACVQFAEEYTASKRPALDSCLGTFNPAKNNTSTLEEARSLGLCQIFDYLEDAINVCNLASCTSFDIETLNVMVEDGTVAGSSSVEFSKDNVRGGSKNVTTHVLFMIGSSSFDLNALKQLTRKEILWKIMQEASEYREFRVSTTQGVPSQTEVRECISSWFEFVESRRQAVRDFKWALLKPVIEELRKMEACSNKESEALPRKKPDHGPPKFSTTLFGRILSKLESLVESVNIISYNGNR